MYLIFIIEHGIWHMRRVLLAIPIMLAVVASVLTFIGANASNSPWISWAALVYLGAIITFELVVGVDLYLATKRSQFASTDIADMETVGGDDDVVAVKVQLTDDAKHRLCHIRCAQILTQTAFYIMCLGIIACLVAFLTGHIYAFDKGMLVCTLLIALRVVWLSTTSHNANES